MKKTIFKTLSLITALSSLCITDVMADYPIFYQRYTADPSGLEYKGRIYIYCSHDFYNGKAEYLMNDFTCISSDDLKNWTDHGEVFKASGWSSLAWAPSVICRNDTFFMYYGNGGGGGIGVATSTTPDGVFKDALGKALITTSSPGVNAPDGFWCFDPGAFIDDDGAAYIYFGGNGEGNTRAYKLGSDLISLSGNAVKITAPIFFEASWLHKYKGKYYFSYSTNFSKGAATINYMMSDDPLSGFVDKGTVLPNPPENEGNNNHHAIFQFKDKWYIAYHNRSVAILNDQPSGDARTYQRSVCIDEVKYDADGSMIKVTPTTDGLKQLKYVNPYDTNQAETMARGSGIQTESCSEGGRSLSKIDNGDWILVKGVDFGTEGATGFEARVASAGTGGNIEIRLENSTGKLVGTCAVPNTGDAKTWVTKTCEVTGATGVNDLCLKFTGSGSDLFGVNWYKFNGSASAVHKAGASSKVVKQFTVTNSNGSIVVKPVRFAGKYSVSVFMPDGQLVEKTDGLAGQTAISVKKTGKYVVKVGFMGKTERSVITVCK